MYEVYKIIVIHLLFYLLAPKPKPKAPAHPPKTKDTMTKDEAAIIIQARMHFYLYHKTYLLY